MIYNFFNYVIAKLGRKNYHISTKIGLFNLLIIIKERVIQILRGLIKRVFLKKCKGILFVGKSVILKHKNKIKLGATVFFGDYVEINALSENGVTIGNNVSIHRGTVIDCTCGIRNIGEGLEIGNNVGISPNCYIQVRGSVKIENNVIIGPGVKIFSESHNYDNLDMYINEQGESRKGVIIEKGVWIGSDVTILDGVRIGNDSIIAAKTLVNKDIPAFSIVGGIPGKVISKRK